MFDVMCNVKSIYVDFQEYRGYMYLPKDNCSDMSSTIKCFKAIDPEITRIYVFVENEVDIVYLIEHDKWVAMRLVKRSPCTAKT